MIQLDAVLDFSDALVFVIALPNIFGLYVLAPIVKAELKNYQARLNSGEIPNLRKLFKDTQRGRAKLSQR